MRGNLMGALSAAAFLSTPVGAHAETAQTAADVRCAVVAFTMTQVPNQSAQTAGMMTALYYLGRLEGRDPDIDLANRLVDEIATMTPDLLKSEAARCGVELAAKGRELQEMGVRMQARAKLAPPNPSTEN